MELNEYQEKAMSTCMDSCHNYSYMMDNLMAEVGEFSGKVAKAKRSNNAWYLSDGSLILTAEIKEEMLRELKKEAGDILWQLTGLVDTMGWYLEDVAQGNLDKLASRKARGVIDGDGDNR